MDFKIRSELVKRHPTTGDVIEVKPAIHAEFGRWSGEQAVYNPESGKTEMHADLIGHFFDTDTWAESRNPLGDKAVAKVVAEEKAMVERVLLGKCETVPGMIRLVEMKTIAAPRPWATYDTQEPENIAAAAEMLDLVPEALAYERENAKRPLVVEALEAALAALPKEAKVRAEPRVGFEEGALDAPEPSGVVLGGAPARTEGGLTAGRSGFTS